jgi:predicted CXXCH cytochrome family protein
MTVACGLSAVAGCRGTGNAAGDGARIPGEPRVLLQSVSASERERYAGSAVCVTCHPAEAAQAASHHAASLSPANTPEQLARFTAPGSQYDPATDTTFAPQAANGRGLLLARRGNRSELAVAEYAIGSGDRGVTYLSQGADGAVELRLSYYRGPHRWNFTPRQPAGTPTETPLGRRVAPAEETLCFACHSTVVVAKDGCVAPESSILGVTCERCHGPGRAHVDAARRHDPDLRMPDLSRDPKRVTLEVCGACHGLPSGGDLADPSASSQLARLQAPALARSACYLNSSLSCMSCHDAHTDIPAASSARYNRICASCHTAGAAGQVSCAVQPQGNCVSCHMPLQAVDRPPVPRFHNHWIGIWDRPGSAVPRRAWSL